ncbi:uncharacterized protein LOC133522414 [Cydia pomonella]|uniref:uncharacterized protein LOC133522414 n=1 Tax=Cydia pomonella TaxID=82600 RepID=UPI002ADE92BB|nr:uncharacterized protein LOC133522414 [Cydia pomonella]
MSVRLADGVSRDMTVLTAEVEVTLKHKTRKTSFVIFPDAVGNENESLLGIDFLKNFDLVVDFRDDLWYFAENSKQKYELQFESVSPPTLCVAALEVLRENEATLLNAQQRELLAQLLTGNRDLFEPGGGPTPFAEHRIDTGDHAPIAVPPYRVTPAKKEVMRAEIEKMLADDIIEECESPWGSPALLVPKANGKSRQPGDVFDVGDSVLIKSHVLSNASKNVSAKFVPKRDGPYLVVKKVSPTTYLVADPKSPGEVLGKYHSSQLVRYNSRDDVLPSPVVPKRNRGRPRNRDQSVVRVHGRGRLHELEGESIACDRDDTPTRSLEVVGTPTLRLPNRTNRGRPPARFLTG